MKRVEEAGDMLEQRFYSLSATCNKRCHKMWTDALDIVQYQNWNGTEMMVTGSILFASSN